MSKKAVALTLAAAGATATAEIALNFSSLGPEFSGIGSLSGGGGDTRLLIDYPEALQMDIMDILFKPNAGASLQLIKVEIGGDAQSTEGVEQTHERFRGDLNCSRGYEWWVLSEAKKRNPGIITYGLSWGAPGWIGGGNYYSDDNIQYHLDWVYCADTQWGVQIDYMGIWNERAYNDDWIKQLRRALDGAGYRNTRIVAADGDWSVTKDMLADPELAASIDVVGAHYPGGAPPADAVAGLNSSFWASEMWNLAVKDDWSGAGYLASDLQRHATYGLSTSIVWCLIYSWYQHLAYGFSTGTNSGAGHSLMTAAEPWSGYYEVNPTLAAVAHWTQFTQRGWHYLNIADAGMGSLPGGGSYTTVMNTHTEGTELTFSIIMSTMQGASSSQDVTFAITGLTTQVLPSVMHVWQSTEGALMVQQADVTVASDGSFTVTVPANAMVSVTTMTGQGWVQPSQPVPASAPFPFPYSDAFDEYADQAYARYWSDMGGVWLVNPLPAALANAPRPPHATVRSATPNKGLQQVVPIVPIAWATNPNPFTCAGNANPNTYPNLTSWTDYTLSAVAAIDADVGPSSEYVTQQETCASGATQQFTLVGGDLFTTPAKLQSVAFSSLCVGFAGPESDPRYPGSTRVALVNCSTAAKWNYDATTKQLVSGTLCLDTYGQNTSVGARTIAWPCETPPGTNEQWTVPSVGSGVSIVANNTGLCVDLHQVAVAEPFVWITTRMSHYSWNPIPIGVALYIYASANASVPGMYQIGTDKGTLSQGATPSSIVPGTWYNMTLVAEGNAVTALLNDVVLATVNVTGYAYGGVALGSGWHSAWYDEVDIRNNTASFV